MLIFLGSSTPEKLRDYQHICAEKKLPVYFRDIRELLDAFHSSEEKSGTYRGNAEEKLSEVEASIRELRRNPSLLQEKCAEYGIPYSPEAIFYATEDTGFRIPKEIWKALDKQGIPPEVLQRIEKNSNGEGPDVETAPVLSAVFGARNLMARVDEASQKLGNSPRSQLPIIESSVLSLKPFLAEHSRPSVNIRGTATNYLFYPDPKSIQPGQRIGTYHHFRPKSNLQKSCAELGPDYVAHLSSRAVLIDNLVEHFHKRFNLKAGIPAHSIKSGAEMLQVGILPSGDGVTQQTAFQNMLSAGSHGRTLAVHIPEHEIQEPTLHARLGAMDSVVKNADAFVLLPDEVTGAGPEQRFEKFYVLFSLMVAKQLVARDMQKPVVILNHDGSWDEAIRNHLHLVNMGMTKDHTIVWPEKLEGISKDVKLTGNSYFDIIRGKNYDSTLEAALKLLEKKRGVYQRRHAEDDPVMEGGIRPDPNRFHVAVFCSAGNENEGLNAEMRKLSHDVAQQGYGVVYGAGDRYTMGAVLGGVVDYRHELEAQGLPPEEARQKAWIGGISTVPILKSETRTGQFSPDLSYYKQTATIYERMADLIGTANSIVVAPGGAGTLQEWLAPLMIRQTMPELVKGKSIVVFNPSLSTRKGEIGADGEKVWDLSLKMALGEKDYALLTKSDPTPAERILRERRSEELGVYVETTREDVQKRLESLNKEWEEARHDSMAAPRRPARVVAAGRA